MTETPTQHHSQEERRIGRPGPGARPRSYRTEAIVLRSFNEGEADRVLIILTPALGRVRVRVRGARRVTSRLGGHVDVLNHARLSLALGHRSDVVTGAESIESFGQLKADLDRLATAIYLAEVAYALVPEDAPHPVAFSVLLGALRSLDAGAGIAAVTHHTELRLLDDAGYMPELHRCLGCGKEIEQGDHRFAPSLGGVVCTSCRVGHGRLLPLSIDALKVLRHFARSRLEQASALSLPTGLSRELEAVLASALHEVLEREMRTSAFVDHLRRLKESAAAAGH